MRRPLILRPLILYLSLAIWILDGRLTGGLAAERPAIRAADDRLVIELFAEHPQVVTPTGIAIKSDGAVYVAESHTHFRPDDYSGPSTDRILVFRDRDGDGVADQRDVFHSGFTHVMDLEFHPDGSLYVATRMDIHRLEDSNGDDHADRVLPVVLMETSGTYPHNGLSGLSFDLTGNLNFGLGENLGHEYTLIGTDGRRLGGGGEGGSTYQVAADGTGLRRVTTGWWNPFGTCVDAFGRVFGTDNDPGASPPCRLIQIVEQADYGYEYRYGRTGLHPLITWTGDIPGTLPMVAGTGEAPCAIVAYESVALPSEYRGRLLVPSWADHRIEQYELRQSEKSGLVETERQILFESEDEFRPVGIAVAPDGTVYVSDWVSSSYQLHKQGRIWRIRPRSPIAARPQGMSAAEKLTSFDRRIREAAARELLDTDDGLAVLQQVALGKPLDSSGQGPVTARTRSVAIQALASVNNSEFPFDRVARMDPQLALRQLALRQHLLRGGDPTPWLRDDVPVSLRLEALLEARSVDASVIERSLRAQEPTLFHAAVVALSKNPGLANRWLTHADPHVVLGAVLAIKRHPTERSRFADDGLAQLLHATDSRVQFAAVKWIADDRLVKRRRDLQALLHTGDLDYRLFLAVSAALDRLADKEPLDRPPAGLLIEQLERDASSATMKRLALRMIDPNEQALGLELLTRLIDHEDPSVRWEAVQTLAGRIDPARARLLEQLARRPDQPVAVRAAAVAGLARVEHPPLDRLIEFALSGPPLVQDEALRSMVGVDLTDKQRAKLRQLAMDDARVRPAVARALSGKVEGLPPSEDLAAWCALLEGDGDPMAGRQVFFGAKVGTCSRCHQVEGRGHSVGPDLSTMHRRLSNLGDQGRSWLLETVLHPSRQMAPQYTPWLIETRDGRQLVGLPRRKGGNAEAYLGSDGKEFTLRKDEIKRHAEMSKSLMPDGLLSALTPQELRDLLAYIGNAELR